MSADTDAPLAGLRVLEFGQIAAGPFAGSLLADMGANVVKVERPGRGDDMRAWPPIVRGRDGAPFSANFASLNRNKRSLVADLKDPDELAAVRELCLRADVVLENFRPGVLERLGLGYPELSSEHPELVYCSISGYGQRGPLAHRGAFDLTVQAASGIMSATGDPDGDPAKVAVPIGDFCAGLYAAYAVLAALRRVGGAYIDCSMLGALLGVSALQTSEYFATGIPAGRLGSAHPRNAPYQAFDASDHSFAMAAGTDRLWRAVCDVVGRPHLADDPRFANQHERARNQRELAGLLAPLFRRRTADEWIKLLDARGVPCSPINTFADTLGGEQVRELGYLRRVRLPNGATLGAVGLPIDVSGYESEIFLPPPLLGEHTDQVIAEWLAQQPDAGR